MESKSLIFLANKQQFTREGNWKRQNFFQTTKYNDKKFFKKRNKVWETFYTLFQKIVNLYCNLVNHFFIINHAPDHFWYETWLKTIYYKYIGKGILCEVVRFCVSLEVVLYVVLFCLETKLCLHYSFLGMKIFLNSHDQRLRK